jgi:hypothetical protein
VATAIAGVAAAGAIPLTASSAGAAGPSLGFFSEPFQEPGLPDGSTPCTKADYQAHKCVPTAVSAAVLANGQILYWNGLEGTELVDTNTVAQFGAVAAPDQSRVLDLSGATPTWTVPNNPTAHGTGTTPPDLFLQGTPYNQGADEALFCSSLLQLPDGRILATGGTDYYDEPGVPGTTFGVSELQGLKNTRIFDPATNTWSETGQMNFGRWYPSTVTLANGDIFVASGVTKLIKPAYSNDPLDSGTNVRQTETFDPSSGKWTDNGAAAERSLPLFPRIHLLPDGKVYYDAGGQVFNPDGQSYDEALWNIAAVYDPATRSWSNLDIPGLGTDFPGFKGSTFSIMLPLAPPYTKASFLAAGGVYGTTPGGYLATPASIITSVDTSGGKDKLSTVQTGLLNNPRWYSSGVLLPDESVMAFSGARQDGVVSPGSEIPVHQAERFDPVTKTWTAMASGHRDRTYHNTAELLPSGAVLVGGHSPIPNSYGIQMTDPGGITANNEKDPSFEIYYPPYFSQQRPVITGAPTALTYGVTQTLTTPDAASITKVLLVRNTSITHLVDGDQRTVELPITSRNGSSVSFKMPSAAQRAVLPAGPYMLFIDRSSSSGLVPSTAVQTFVGRGTSAPGWAVASSTAGSLNAPAIHGAPAASAAGAAAPQSGVQVSGGAAATRIGSRTAAVSLNGSPAAKDRRLLGIVAAVVSALLMLAAAARRRRVSAVQRT